MFTSLHLATSKTFLFVVTIFLLFLLPACGPSQAETQVNVGKPTPTPFNYVVRVKDQKSGENLFQVRVMLSVEGQPPITDLTDSFGMVVLKVNTKHAGTTGKLTIEQQGYKPYVENLVIQADSLPDLVLLDKTLAPIAITETPTAVSINTVPPTQEQTTNTPVPPTNTLPPPPTATTKPTDTPTSSATSTPVATGQIIAQVTETSQDTWVYAGPGDANVKLGSMRPNETGLVLGKDKWNGWYKIRTDNNIEGWVDISHLTITQGNPNEVAVIWPSSTSNSENNSNTTTELPSGGRSSSSCSTVSLDFREWPNETFDDITVSWTNVPPNTAYFIFAANGTLNGEAAPLIYPTQVNVHEEYFIGKWKFAERGFTTGGTFSYALQAKTNKGTTICTTTGTFTQ